MSIRLVLAFLSILAAPACVDLGAPPTSIADAAGGGIGRATEESYQTGLRYMTGTGMPRDEPRGVDIMTQAAGEGHADAQFVVGDSYARGRGVARVPEWAVMWYGRAAASGHTEAQYRLAHAHVSGIGANVDLVEAYKWLTIAAAAGHEAAARDREVLSGRMIRQEIEPAEQAAKQWAPQRTQSNPDEPLVRFVQVALSELGYGSGTADGVMGKRTQAALRDFARREGLQTTEITPELVQRLRARLRNGQNEAARLPGWREPRLNSRRS
jgi:localization factor PodJL